MLASATKTTGTVVQLKLRPLQNSDGVFGDPDLEVVVKYSDLEGNTHFDTFYGSEAVGSKVELIYDRMNPDRAWRSGEYQKDSILVWLVSLASYGAAFYFLVNFLAKIFFQKKDFLGAILRKEPFGK